MNRIYFLTILISSVIIISSCSNIPNENLEKINSINEFCSLSCENYDVACKNIHYNKCSLPYQDILNLKNIDLCKLIEKESFSIRCMAVSNNEYLNDVECLKYTGEDRYLKAVCHIKNEFSEIHGGQPGYKYYIVDCPNYEDRLSGIPCSEIIWEEDIDLPRSEF